MNFRKNQTSKFKVLVDLLKKHWKFLLFAIILGLIIQLGIKYYTGVLKTAHGNSDMNVLLALQEKMNDPSLFAKDHFFLEIEKIYPRVANLVQAFVLRFLGRYWSVIFLSAFLLVVFMVGNYLLSYFIFKDKKIAFLTALFVSYGHKAVNGAFWGIKLGSVMTQYFVIPLVPFILLFFLKCRTNFLRTLALFFFIGLLANVHFLAMMSLAGILLFTLLMSDKFYLRAAAEKSLYLAAFVIGTLPYLLSALSISQGILPLNVLQYRLYRVFDFPIAENFANLILPTSLGICGFILKKKTQTDYALRNFLCATFVFVFGGTLLSFIFTKLLLLQFYRFSIYFYLPLLPYAAYFLLNLFMKRNFKFKLLLITTTIFLVIPPAILIQHFFPKISETAVISFRQRNPLEAVDKQLFVQIGQDWKSFIDLTDWLQKNTAKDDILLVFPFDGSAVRAFAKRAIVVSWKDGGALLLAQTPLVKEWYDTYNEVIQLYLTNSTDNFLKTAKKYNAKYIVVDKTKNRLDLPILYTNKRFIVYGNE